MEFTHIANPVSVNARQIVGVHLALDGMNVGFSDGSFHMLNAAQISRHTPVIGDYIVTQEDGYVYVNPKDVFERKYSPIR
jgi:hypothetical protein